MTDDETDDVVDALLQSDLMDQTADYLQRGRRFETVLTPELNEQWVAAFRDFIQAETTACETGEESSGCDTRDLDDTASELRLRGLDPPFDGIEEKDSGALQKLLQTVGPDASESLDRKIEQYLTDRKKPKN
jgi:hypothetical protein